MCSIVWRWRERYEMLGNSSTVEYSLERFANRMTDGNQNDIMVGQYEDLEDHILLGNAGNIENAQFNNICSKEQCSRNIDTYTNAHATLTQSIVPIFFKI